MLSLIRATSASRSFLNFRLSLSWTNKHSLRLLSLRRSLNSKSKSYVLRLFIAPRVHRVLTLNLVSIEYVDDPGGSRTQQWCIVREIPQKSGQIRPEIRVRIVRFV